MPWPERGFRVYGGGVVSEPRAARLAGNLAELVFPGRCLLCGRSLFGCCLPWFPVCHPCLAGLVALCEPQRCRVCSVPLVSESEVCTRCRTREFSFAANHALFEYRGDIRELVYQFKLRRRRRLALVFAHLLAPVYRDRYGSLPAVPIPGHRRGVRKRGWDPMVEVVRALRAIAGVPVLRLLRRGASHEQKGLDFEGRMANLRGTIRVRAGEGQVPAELVLVDDIFTTGATASECARILRLAGARRIEVLTLAID